MNNFWEKYSTLCVSNKQSANGVAKILGIASSTVTSWKNGVIPNGETLEKIAQYFDVSIEYLMTDDEIDIKPSKKKKTDLFKSLFSLQDRWFCLRKGNEIDERIDISKLEKFLRCKAGFLTDPDYPEFTPLSNLPLSESINNIDVLDTILGIMDKCADSSKFTNIQINLSNIVIYWLEKKGITYDILRNSPDRSNYRNISCGKLDFLYNKEKILTKFDPAYKFGFNFTELDQIREVNNLSFLYMFTGIEESPIITLQNENTELKKEIAELKARLAKYENV